MNNLSKEDQEFINNLSHEMKIQDNRSTAQPFGLTIISTREETRPEGVGGYNLYRRNDETFYKDDFASFKEDLLEEYENKDFIITRINACNSFSDLERDWELWNELEIESFDYDLVEDVSKMDFNFFLTEKACNDHIAKNRYHYRDPKSYGVCLIRNPEIERLYSIIHKLASNQEKGE